MNLERKNKRLLLNEIQDAVDICRAEGNNDIDKKKKSRQFSRSLYVAKDIKKGDLFTDENIRSVRPGYGLKPKHYDAVLGKRANRKLEKGTALSWDMISSWS
jgi:pseudaminic acid synthase